jgi:Mn-dependent DtxR family transcriptional regulator
VRGGGGEILANNLTYPILTEGGLQIWKMLMEQLRVAEHFSSSILALSVDILTS